jgi:RimJ/RimL family protein N-acetyltransferase
MDHSLSSARTTLTTARLILSLPVIEDWEPYAGMWADPRVTTYIGGTPRPRDVAWLKFTQMAGMWLLFGYGYWIVRERRGTFLGVAGFARFERGIAALGQFPEAGWAFHPDAWGKGIASETLAAMVAWADAQNLGETRCLIDDSNVASRKVAARCGFGQRDSIGTAHVFARGQGSVS